MCDLPGADQLVINAFKQIFDLAKYPWLYKLFAR